MYRDSTLADRVQIETLRADLGDTRAELEALARARDLALAEVHRLREGLGADLELTEEREYRGAQLALRVLGALAVIVLVAGLVPLLWSTFEAPLPTWQGVLNLWFHLRHGQGAIGLASAGALVVLSAPLWLLPILGAVGLRRTRRWGWFCAVGAAGLWLLSPLMPISIYALGVLFGARVRALYFPRPDELLDEPSDEPGV